MDVSRYGRARPADARATAGAVFMAVTRDPWAKQLLGEIYQRLFEGQGLRQGSSPDHFIYVTPSKARAHIGALQSWITERFGAPGACVPAKTPFGYLSSPWDGWITYFAALDGRHGTDRGLALDFAETVAQVPWRGSSVSLCLWRRRRRRGGGGLSPS